MTLERRRHVKFVTRNTEYHLRDRECVGVLDRRTGLFLLHHPAVRGTLVGGLDRRSRLFQKPIAGLRLVFSTKGHDVLTSPVQVVDRPERRYLESYTWRTKAGEIQTAVA
jgi:hypothetical protein